MKRSTNIICCAMLFYSLPSISIDENGYYSTIEVLKNLVQPIVVDNPVNESEREGLYPLLSSPENFEDTFKPLKYGFWQTVQLDSEATQSFCGNGSPYKFFVRRAATNANYVIYLEGGGACWDYGSCSGEEGIRGARNPDGIVDDYMQKIDTRLVTPFLLKGHYANNPETQDWNMVYVPYCTGDVYAGDQTITYESDDGKQLEWNHNGLKNMRAVVAWLRDNMQSPHRMLLTGCSAGGVGALVNYHDMRRDLHPTKSFLLSDSGPLFPTTEGGANWSKPLHDKIRQSWGIDAFVEKLNQEMVGDLDINNLGTFNNSLALTWPGDRLSAVHFSEDLIYSSYSYERFYREIEEEEDLLTKQNMLHEKWYDDTAELMYVLDQHDNFGYYFPQFRDLNESHCATIVDFLHTDIQEENMNLSLYLDHLLYDTGEVRSYYEQSPDNDYAKRPYLYYQAINQLLGAPRTTHPDRQ